MSVGGAASPTPLLHLTSSGGGGEDTRKNRRGDEREVRGERDLQQAFPRGEVYRSEKEPLHAKLWLRQYVVTQIL